MSAVIADDLRQMVLNAAAERLDQAAAAVTAIAMTGACADPEAALRDLIDARQMIATVLRSWESV